MVTSSCVQVNPSQTHNNQGWGGGSDGGAPVLTDDVSLQVQRPLYGCDYSQYEPRFSWSISRS